MMFDLSGRVALVTGSGQNVGAGIARALARQGARVAINDLVAERADSTAAAIVAAGGVARAFAFDVTDADEVRRGVSDIESALGPIDVLVNNAGVPREMGLVRFRELDPARWHEYVDLNLYGVLHGVKAVLDGMVERGFGRVITISSGAGQMGVGIGVSLYGAAKAGAIGFTRHLALEVGGTGVTANCVALGLMNNAGGAAVTERIAATIPARRLGTPEDVGAAVVYLASDEASWVTGQTLGVNGGSHTP
jgi:3-oxoacyl-[acyl-carrier protein] reductase